MRETVQLLGRPIFNLQTMLRLLSQTNSRILPLVPDGIYGANTYASIRSFQEYHVLPATGETDLATWNKVVEEYNAALQELPAPEGLHLVQAMLRAISEYYPAIAPPEVTGIMNPRTVIGIRWIQASANLPPTGTITPATQEALYILYRTLT